MSRPLSAFARGIRPSSLVQEEQLQSIETKLTDSGGQLKESSRSSPHCDGTVGDLPDVVEPKESLARARAARVGPERRSTRRGERRLVRRAAHRAVQHRGHSTGQSSAVLLIDQGRPRDVETGRTRRPTNSKSPPRLLTKGERVGEISVAPHVEFRAEAGCSNKETGHVAPRSFDPDQHRPPATCQAFAYEAKSFSDEEEKNRGLRVAALGGGRKRMRWRRRGGRETRVLRAGIVSAGNGPGAFVLVTHTFHFDCDVHEIPFARRAPSGSPRQKTERNQKERKNGREKRKNRNRRQDRNNRIPTPRCFREIADLLRLRPCLKRLIAGAR